MRVVEAEAVVIEQLETGSNRREGREELIGQVLVVGDPLVAESRFLRFERKRREAIAQGQAYLEEFWKTWSFLSERIEQLRKGGR